VTSSRARLVEFTSGGRQEIDLQDVSNILMWLGWAPAYAKLVVTGQMAVLARGTVRDGVFDHDRGEFRVRVGETRFAFPVDSFVSASIEAHQVEVVCGAAKLAIQTSMAGDAWRHAQISQRWVAEQPDKPGSPFGPGTLRRLP
jgi:hypothetical protein